MRRYAGFVSDSARWERFDLRPDDVVISVPSKCGTTWMQTMVGMLIFGSPDLPAPIGSLSPWMDMLTRSEDEVFGILSAQSHRRFIKTHTPLDGLPWSDTVTYLTVMRHPLDVAMSIRDHLQAIDRGRVRDLLVEVAGNEHFNGADSDDPPEDLSGYLGWWIDRESEQWEDGAGSLAELVMQSQTYWRERHRPNVHLFHYDDLWNDLPAEMRRLAEGLGVAVPPDRWPELAEAANLDSMRSRAAVLVPESDLDIWETPTSFFRTGGRRAWADLLSPQDLEQYRLRLVTLVGMEHAAWIDRSIERRG